MSVHCSVNYLESELTLYRPKENTLLWKKSLLIFPWMWSIQLNQAVIFHSMSIWKRNILKQTHVNNLQIKWNRTVFMEKHAVHKCWCLNRTTQFTLHQDNYIFSELRATQRQLQVSHKTTMYIIQHPQCCSFL